jgi:hypothetical protein
MKIGGWRTRSVFERYAIVSRSDMNDAILKLQESEKRAEQERIEKEERQAQTKAQIGHNDEISTRGVNPQRETVLNDTRAIELGLGCS